MTIRRLPALIPTDRRDRHTRYRGRAATLVHCGSRPGAVWVSSPYGDFELTLETLTGGLHAETVDPFTGVTVQPCQHRNWIAVDVDPDVRLLFRGTAVAGFLADVVLEQFLPGLPRTVEVERDWLRPLPFDGGAL